MDQQLLEDITDMGYVLPTSRTINSSCYRLTDGTESLVRITFDLHSITPDLGHGNFKITSSVHVQTFVPPKNRKPEKFKPHDPNDLQSGVMDDDIGYEALSEDFSTFELSNGFVLGIKCVLAQVKRTMFFTPAGEPVYLFNASIVQKVTKKK